MRLRPTEAGRQVFVQPLSISGIANDQLMKKQFHQTNTTRQNNAIHGHS